MTRVSREAFRDCLDGLDPADRTAFVEAVYDARGWETGRVDGDLWVTPPASDASRRVAVPRGADDGESDATGDGDTVTVGADALLQLVRYAVDDAARERLFRQFFDSEPSDLDRGDAGSGAEAESASDDASPAGTGASPPTTDGRSEETARRRPTAGGQRTDATTRPRSDAPRRARASERDATTDGDGTGRASESTDDVDTDADGTPVPTVRWIAVGLVAVVVVGGVVAAVGPGLTSSAADDAASGRNGTASPDVMEREGLPVAPGVRRVEAAEGSLPPGVDSTGVTDASALADAHEAALADRSFRLRITHREFVDGELRGVAHERAVVDSPGHYRSGVRTLGAIRHESGVIAPASTYANGTTEYVRRSGSDAARKRVDVRSRTGMDDVVDRTERAVRWYLSVDDSRIVGVDGGTVRIAIRGDPWPDSRNVTGWARVDEDGLVRELHREYTPASAPNVRVEVTIRIVPGPVTVTRPAWMEPTTEERAPESDGLEPSTSALAAPDGRVDGGRA